MKKIFIPGFIFFCCCAIIFSSISDNSLAGSGLAGSGLAGSSLAGNGLIVHRTIDWENGIVHLYLDRAWKQDDGFSPATKFIIDREIRKKLPDVFLESISDISVDSSHTIFDMVKNDGPELDRLKQFALTGKNEGTWFSGDFKNIHTHYSFPFFDDSGLLRLFIRHSYINSIQTGLGFIPSDNFTGLVIYAKGEYPYHGTNKEVMLAPSFFPAFYDEEMNLILDRRNCDPAYLKTWGMAIYTDKVEDIHFVKRIGGNPLRTMAAGIFGNNNCDIILPTETVKKLLSREQNKQILSQGRILILIDPVADRTEVGSLNQEE